MTREEREQALEWFKNRPITMSGAKKMYDLAIAALEQPERKRGEWTETKEWGGRNYSCSCCKFSFMVDTCMLNPMWNFCPQCGAEMKGEEK